MHIAVFGQPQAGKSTVFEALAGAPAAVLGAGPAVATIKVPDGRLDALTVQFKPRKTVYADVTLVDVRVSGATFSKSDGLSASYIDALQKADALALVVRAFADDSVPHPEGSVDPARDAAAMLEEVAFTDQVVIAKRLERIAAQIAKVKPSEREAMERDQRVLTMLLAGLESGVPIREQTLDGDDERAIRHYRFLTQRPVLVIANIGEDQIESAAAIEESLAAIVGAASARAVAISGKIERELIQLEGEEAAEFRETLGLVEPARSRVLREAYALLGLISFFTVGPDECRAWPIAGGTVAQRAAAAVHSDIEKGFIRAEVVAYGDLLAAGSLAECRKRAQLRSEGKTYLVKDGDVIEYLFNL